MIKMIIADDESVIIRGIQKLIDWEKYGITIVGSYQDGKSAFDGIIKTEAEIALLDVNMPKMSGVDILKELGRLGMNTKVIFISGFQEFEYARAALMYGAKGYLLKPVIRRELIDHIQTCIEEIRKEHGDGKPEFSEETKGNLKWLADMEETVYVPALLHIICHEKDGQERKLIRFSVASFLENRLRQDDKGISFEKDGCFILVFKGMDREELNDYITKLGKDIEEKTRHQVGILVGREVRSMGDIPDAYRECQKKYGYFFFFNEWRNFFIYQEDGLFHQRVAIEELEKSRKKLIELLISQNKEGWEKQFQWFCHCIAVAAEGKREDAAFYFCTGIRAVQSDLREMRIETRFDMKELLEEGRNAEDFAEMSDIYRRYFYRCYLLVLESADKSDNKSIAEIKRYIEKHYQENLTLEVMAEQFHMNTYYFSSFFKKNMGMNFKEYLNEIRLKQAVTLLISSDKNMGEIMRETGFADMRAFTKVFQKKYNETPGKYKKRIMKSRKGPTS